MKPTGLNYLLPGIFLTECNFANYVKFKKKLQEHFSHLPFEKEEVIAKINELIKVKDGKINQNKAEELLFAEELKKIKRSLKEADIPDPELLLKEHYEKIKDLMRRYDLIKKFPSYYIVDNFPKPFDSMSWICMFLDEEEKDVYNMEPGIYFKKEYLDVYSSSKNLLHELVHIAVSQNTKTPGIARGLEDGICDVLGSLFLFSELTNINLSKNIMKYTKFDYKDMTMGPLYLDNIRMALLLYKKYGLDGLVELVKSGRDKIRETEESCLEGKYNFTLKRGNWKKEFDELADYFLGFQKNLVVSPLAYYTANILKEKQDVEDLISNNNLDQSAGEALKELQERVFLISLNNEKIEYDASKIYLKGALRYENT